MTVIYKGAFFALSAIGSSKFLRFLSEPRQLCLPTTSSLAQGEHIGEAEQSAEEGRCGFLSQ